MTNYDTYLRTCSDILSDDKKFASFRKNKAYRIILEHCNQDIGRKYLNEIEENIPWFLVHLKDFATSESVGMPITYNYNNVDISPTTLRYIKVLADLIFYHGALNDIDIIEIGSGYGGQCKIIHDIYKPKSYTLVDLHYPLKVAEKFLNYFDVHPILRNKDNTSNIKYDLCISNYAFSEIDRHYQDFYYENIIKHSKHGYMTCNFMDNAHNDGRMTKREIMALMNGKEVEEIPNTAKDNFIYIW